MIKLRNFVVVGAMTAVAAVPLVLTGAASAQDAGSCGNGGTAASAAQLNLGGLLGAVAPDIDLDVVPNNEPEQSPNVQTCNQNIVNPVVAAPPAPLAPPAVVAPVQVVAVPRFAG